jgi:hypothetical protein
MSIIDDPMLALIARFVLGDIDNLGVSDEEFLQHQVAAIKEHIGDAPPELRQQLALEWIKEHAEQYRREWQRRTLSRVALEQRCADCPLIHEDPSSSCAIHDKWLLLLQQYIDGDISSDNYVEETLDLLGTHKLSLKITAVSSRMHSQAATGH